MRASDPRSHSPSNVAVVWDFDGTLVDTRRKNLEVTRRVIEKMTGKPHHGYRALSSLAEYDAAHARSFDWRQLYARELGMSEAEITHAASLWAEHQIADSTETPAFEGVPEALEALEDLPHGIFSMNARGSILGILGSLRLGHHFRTVVGYEEVGLDQQKPEPHGLLSCLEELTKLRPGRVFFVGDHELDFQSAANARARLGEEGIEITSIGLLHGSPPRDWGTPPDLLAEEPAEVAEIIAARA